jgi:hypothetical protein
VEIVDSIGLFHGRDKWSALVKMIMNLRVTSNVGTFGLSRRTQLDTDW